MASALLSSTTPEQAFAELGRQRAASEAAQAAQAAAAQAAAKDRAAKQTRILYYLAGAFIGGAILARLAL
jgi:hypothetical protein